MELTPQLIQSIFDGCTRKRQPEIRIDFECSLRNLALRVFDGLGLIENHHVPFLGRQLLLVTAKEGIRGDDQICFFIQFAIWPMVDRDPKTGPEPRRFVFPISQYTSGSHHQRSSTDHTQRLNRLSKTHIVGKNTAHLGIRNKIEPV